MFINTAQTFQEGSQHYTLWNCCRVSNIPPLQAGLLAKIVIPWIGISNVWRSICYQKRIITLFIEQLNFIAWLMKSQAQYITDEYEQAFRAKDACTKFKNLLMKQL